MAKTISDYIGASARENIETALEKAKEYEDYNIFTELLADRALSRAVAVDNGEITGRLAGVPFAVKDNFATYDGETTAASKILKGYNSPIQATVVERLEAEGAIFIGKVNLDAFAHGSTTENSAYGVTKNAVDKTRAAGGSSGGSAVAVALDIVPFALGSDTGGSIRQPASYNGVVGVKPTYGAVSRYGVVAMASSTDVMGVLTHTSADASLLIDIISGKDDKDGTTLDDFFIPETDVTSQKIGIIKEFMTDDVDADVRARTLDYIERLKKAGHTVEEVSLPLVKYALAVYYVIVPAEVSSNLARYDGVRYATRARDAKNLGELYGKTRDQGFELENKRRILIGSFVLSSGFYDAYYLQAQKVRTRIIEEFDEAFKEFDMLIGPVTPETAPLIGAGMGDPIKVYLSDVMTVAASIAGLPAISIPAGLTTEGLPVGVQLIGPLKSDANILALASSLEGNQ
jgi:aspartyl-tRNA(Asn)/glutamyl-tRNA(Gln) amidotransferase subunit A